MPDGRPPKKVLDGELQEGKRSQRGQKKRYKDTLKASLKDFDIPIPHRISGNVERTIRSKNADLFDRPVLRVRQLNLSFFIK